MRGMKKVYVYEDLNHNPVSPYFAKRNGEDGCLKWAREHKDIANKSFLMQREVTRKRYNQLFPDLQKA